jgi:hypothetical protein
MSGDKFFPGVNPAQCAGRHADIPAAYARTGMARSFASFKPPMEAASYFHGPSSYDTLPFAEQSIAADPTSGKASTSGRGSDPEAGGVDRFANQLDHQCPRLVT